MKRCVVLFHPPEDTLSRLLYFIGLKRWGKVNYIHVSLYVGGYVYELTWDGFATTPRSAFTRPITGYKVLYVDEYDYDLIHSRLFVLSCVNPKVSMLSLLCLLLGKPVRGLLCTDLVKLALGDVPLGLTPDQLFYELGDGGRYGDSKSEVCNERVLPQVRLER